MALHRSSDESILRRSANYKPSIWDYNYIQSLKNEYVKESYSERAMKLKGQVRMMLKKLIDPLHQLELIDTLQRLGLSYHFENEINKILKGVNENNQENDAWKKGILYVTSLEFRLLRQHGYNVSQEVFNSFKEDELGITFKTLLSEDIKGMLSLYEASYLLVEGETILEEAKNFTTKHLIEYVNKESKDEYLSMLVSHALELPLHWRMQRLEAKWFIDIYERKRDLNHLLLELAKLDFNMVQATHQDDLKHASRWWRNTGLTENLSFSRDRLVESFLWTVGLTYEPQYEYCRRMLTKIVQLVTTIDDIYDVYGTLDELKLFTNAVERWDVNELDHLPEYMRLCFLVLHNNINDMGFHALKEQGFNIIPYLKKPWVDLCKAYLLEAKWYNIGYTPTLQEYMENGWISISSPVMIMHAYSIVSKPISKHALDCLSEYHNIVRCSGIICRFVDDLGTSSDELKRGDVPKAIQCYMHENGASEKDAREHIQYLIRELWKKMNEYRIENSLFSKTFIEIVCNMQRTAQNFYLHGDGMGVQDLETKDNILSLLVNPIPNI